MLLPAKKVKNDIHKMYKGLPTCSTCIYISNEWDTFPCSLCIYDTKTSEYTFFRKKERISF